MMNICLVVNGKQEKLRVNPRWTLLKVLRETLDLTGVKAGCNTGDCGACRVIIDGEAVNSCMILAKNVSGKEIVTIEGLSHGTRLHPIQESFIEAGAVQCGYCTPGMVMSAKALLDGNPRPTEAEIRRAINPNICRCTGYVKIVDGVRKAVGKLSGE